MSDAIDNYEYLEPSFDPQVLRIAELRRIFYEHNIDFKTSAKKAELIQIFNEDIKPHGAEILRARRDPARYSNKIEEVGVPQSPAVFAQSPTKTPRRGPGRPRKHPLPEDEASFAAKKEPGTAKKSVGRPRKVPKLETDDTPTPEKTTSKAPAASSRKTEKSERASSPELPSHQGGGVLKRTSQLLEDLHDSANSSFSSLNPFQSDSSPPPASSPSKRRQTAIPNSTQKLAPPLAKAARRKTDLPVTPSSISSVPGTNDIEITFTRTGRTPSIPSSVRKQERFMPSISSLKASPAFQTAAQKRKENSLASNQLLSSNTDHEFTDDDVEHEEDLVHDDSLTPARKLLSKHNPSSSLKDFLKLATISSLVAGTAFGANLYRNEKFKAGYCGVDSYPVTTPVGASDWDMLVHRVVPQCVPCPPHAICRPGFRMICEDEFQKVYPPASLGGLLPVSPVCVPDTEKLQRIRIVAEEIVQTLRDRTASVECGYETAPVDGNIAMSAEELKAALSAKKSSTITAEQFDVLFTHALDEVKTLDEVEITSR